MLEVADLIRHTDGSVCFENVRGSFIRSPSRRFPYRRDLCNPSKSVKKTFGMSISLKVKVAKLMNSVSEAISVRDAKGDSGERSEPEGGTAPKRSEGIAETK